MRNRMYGGVRGRKTKVGEKLLRFPPTRFLLICHFFNLSHLFLISMKKLQYNLVLLAFSIIFAENIISYGIIRFF